MRARIKSNDGFYIGDICYVLNDDLYHNVWGGIYEYQDCVVRDPKTGIHFAVAGTRWGDGTYVDQYGHQYPVDAGVIGIVPLELAKDIDNARELGYVKEEGGEAKFWSADGVFKIVFPNGEVIEIDTAKEWADRGWY